MNASSRLLKCILFLSACATKVSAFGGIEHFAHHVPVLQDALSTVPANAMLVDQSAECSIITSALVNESPEIMDAVSMAWSDYQVALKTQPYPTKMATGVVLAFVGDAIAQLREPASYDKKRAVAFATFDAVYRAVQQFTYPPLIAKLKGQFILALLGSLGLQSIASLDSVTNLSGPLEQTLVSQLVIIPTLYYPVFYAVTGTVQGLSMDETIQRAKDTFIPLMKRNLLFWIPIQFGAFGFIQEDLQIPVLILCGLVWTIILSISAGAVKSAEDEVLDEDILPEIAMNEIVSNGINGITVTKAGEKETTNR
jgi:protein Mpv17